uniref:Uncharacterized protein n=1 Tax=Anguilla anguilla TaxID=7936 RepID=A0A0E9UKG1_ANGAN
MYVLFSKKPRNLRKKEILIRQDGSEIMRCHLATRHYCNYLSSKVA